MAEWFKVLQLTARNLSTLLFLIPARAHENVASHLGLGGGFQKVI